MKLNGQNVLHKFQTVIFQKMYRIPHLFIPQAEAGKQRGTHNQILAQVSKE